MPTPAEGWTIKDQVSHLAYFDDSAHLALLHPEDFRCEAAKLIAGGMDFPDRIAEQHRTLPHNTVLDWFSDSRRQLLAGFTGDDPKRRLPWFGPDMSVASSATARLMETWAHGQDIYDTLDVPHPPSPGLRNIAHLGVATFAFAHTLNGLDIPAEPVRVELLAPGRRGLDLGPRRFRTLGAWVRRRFRAGGHPAAALDRHESGRQRDHRDAVAGHRPGVRRSRQPASGPGGAIVNPLRPVRIGNASAFYGDRLASMRALVDGGHVDVITGDYLAELTMLILWKARKKDPAGGYARTFLTQFQQVVTDCADRGIKIVVNAGGLNPAGMAEQVRAIAAEAGVTLKVAYVEGDDLMPQLDQLRTDGIPFTHLDTGVDLNTAAVQPVSANAYLGGWGIAAALSRGADIVITGRVTDAALVVGVGAWWHDWARTDYDALAGAVAAGHIIECGPQACGGNYSQIAEIADRRYPGSPIAELAHDGTKGNIRHCRTQSKAGCYTRQENAKKDAQRRSSYASRKGAFDLAREAGAYVAPVSERGRSGSGSVAAPTRRSGAHECARARGHSRSSNRRG